MEWYVFWVIIGLTAFVYFNIGYLYWYLDKNGSYPKFLKFLWRLPKSWNTNEGKISLSNKSIKLLEITIWPILVTSGIVIFLFWLIFGGVSKMIINKKIDYI